MDQRRHFISDQYHFIAEMIILSVVLLLPIYFYYMWIPKWSALAVAVPLCVVFTFLEKKSIDYKSYYYIAPLLLLPFSLLKFPLILCLPISVLIIWRYLRIRQLFLSGRESSYILLTAMLSIVVYIVTDDLVAIGFLFLQVFVLVFGFAFSHVAVSNRTKRSLLIFQSGMYFVSFLLMGALVAFWISTQSYIERLFDNLIYVIFSFFGRILNLFSFLDPSDFETLIEGLDGLQEKPALMEIPAMDYIGYIVGVYVTIGLIIATVGLIVVLKIFKRDPSSQEGIDSKTVNLGVVTEEYDSYDRVIRAIKRWRIGKKHSVRILVHEFERKALKHKMGRRKSETLNEWFNRIGLHVNVEVYQKVRYGNLDVSEEEVEDLKNGLKKLKDRR